MGTVNVLASLIVMTLCAQSLHGQDEPRHPSMLVQSNDVAGVVIRKTVNREWVKSIDTAGRPLGTHGVVQEIDVQGVKARIHYAEFNSSEEAHQAAEFHIKNVASIFKAGLWEGARLQLLGDETWSNRGTQTCALLLRSGETCVLVSCHGSDIKRLEHVAEILAERIAHKAGNGARVPSPRGQ